MVGAATAASFATAIERWENERKGVAGISQASKRVNAARFRDAHRELRCRSIIWLDLRDPIGRRGRDVWAGIFLFLLLDGLRGRDYYQTKSK
jgi:hypothetical protein